MFCLFSIKSKFTNSPRFVHEQTRQPFTRGYLVPSLVETRSVALYFKNLDKYAEVFQEVPTFYQNSSNEPSVLVNVLFDLLFLSNEAELSRFLFSKAVWCKHCPKIWAKK